MVSTLDSESSDLSSNLSGTSSLTFIPIFQVPALLPTLCYQPQSTGIGAPPPTLGPTARRLLLIETCHVLG